MPLLEPMRQTHAEVPTRKPSLGLSGLTSHCPGGLPPPRFQTVSKAFSSGHSSSAPRSPVCPQLDPYSSSDTEVHSSPGEQGRCSTERLGAPHFAQGVKSHLGAVLFPAVLCLDTCKAPPSPQFATQQLICNMVVPGGKANAFKCIAKKKMFVL